MKKIKSKSLLVFIVLCLLLTGLFHAAAAPSQAEDNLNTEMADEQDGDSQVDSESLKKDIPIEPQEPAYCPHYWTYTSLGFNHKKTCVNCGKEEFQQHTKVYISQGAHYHSERCKYCSFSLLTAHIGSGMYINDGNSGHHLNCGKCGAPCATKKHDIMYMSNGSNRHTQKCITCNYSRTESHTFGPWIPGGISHEKRCSSCNELQIQSHSLKYYNAGPDYHLKECSICNYSGKEKHIGDGRITGTDPNRIQHCKHCKTLMHVPCSHSGGYTLKNTDAGHYKVCNICSKSYDSESHNYKYVTNGAENHKQICSVCNYEKGTEPHSFRYKEDGSAGHYKYCTTCGRRESTQSHTLVNGKCSVCGYNDCQHSNVVYRQTIGNTSAIDHLGICNDCGKQFTERHFFGNTNRCIKCNWRPDGIDGGNKGQ